MLISCSCWCYAGALFAECIVPQDAPLSTVGHFACTLFLLLLGHLQVFFSVLASDLASPFRVHSQISQVVEAVVDSSRYFALKIEDRASNRHAFIGIGFR